MKGVAGIVVALIAIGLLAGVFIIAKPNLGGLLSAGAGAAGAADFNQERDCDTDGLARLVVAYEDGLADDVASLATDVFVYEFDPSVNAWTLAFTNADETSATFGTYNEVSTNLLVCGHKYQVWLGDETEEPFRGPFEFVAKGSEVKYTAKGFVIGGETWTGFDQGTLESTVNITVGSGGTTNNLKTQWQSSTSDQGHEAKDGFIVGVEYNDTAYLRIEPTGVSNLQGKVTSNGASIQEVTCPLVMTRTILTTNNADIVEKCWKLPITYTADGGGFDISWYIAAESGVDPAVAGDCTGGSIGACGFTIGLIDQNGFRDTESPNSPIKYGYQGDDEDNIGEPTRTVLSIFTN